MHPSEPSARRICAYTPPVPSIAILIFDGVEELDFVGPWEVLSAWASQHPTDDVRVSTVRWGGSPHEPVQCAKRLRVLADRGQPELGEPDVIVVPGGKGTRALLKDEPLAEALREVHARGGYVTSVCTGSLILAAAGLLDGKPATTHWSTLEHLAAAGEDIEVRADDRFVQSGRIITAAGVSAGIDMALHLVVQLASVERAREVKRYIQYDPAPPV